MNPIFISAEQVAQHLSYEACIPLMREAMIALSTGRSRQLLRGIVDLEEGRAFGVMPGARLDSGAFGAKLVSVYPENFAKGVHSHQGVVVLFDPDSGAPAAIIEAGELTAIRTAAASAAATDALARPEARSLAVLGYGEQAWRHIAALRVVRPLEQVRIWGRDLARAEALAKRVRAKGLAAEVAADVPSAVEGADIICTVSAAPEPILFSASVADGTHINAVGSSRAGRCEIDPTLVARGRFIADHRDGVMAQGEEYIRARKGGLIAENDRPVEIGEVFAGLRPGRSEPGEITIYKSLGSIVQDLAAGDFAWRAVRGEA